MISTEESAESWPLVRLGALVQFKSGDAISGEKIRDEGDYPVFGGGGFRGYTDTYNTMGDRALVGRQGALCGNVTFARSRFFATEHSLVAHPRTAFDARWLAFLLEAMNLRQYSMSAAQPGLAAENLAQLRVPVPLIAEQEAIAEFLDRETAEIDAFIADQEELIALLTERRAATISHAVIRGLDPSAQTAPTGVNWLGDIPSHWTVRSAIAIGRTFGSEPIAEDELASEGVIAFLKVSSLSSSSLQLESIDWYVNDSQRAVTGEFVVFPKRGAAIFGNKVNVATGPAVIDPNLMGWQLFPSNSPRYFAYVLKCVRLEELADVSTVPQINVKHLRELRLPVPPVDEQVRIAHHIDREVGELDAAIADASEAIALSRERRAALISAAVSGKIDVRSAA
ncbi:restriction endonuclease subunit S [Agromyces sp. H66]|uniref:restriction endonuclease subunit S n=1 Tax=Agromyces sp. H66 TaxID=2529859 RepID=UPI0010AA3886|nr:restriction endonuclease subunit S [Agromyces sp. H66]